MKRTARVIVMILLVASLLSMSTALAAERASYYISRCSVAATKVSDGVKITFSIMATNDMTDLGATKIVIRNAYDIPVETFEYTDAGCSHMMAHNDAIYTNSITYEDAVPGARYRGEVYFMAGDSTGSDTAILISDWVIA